MASLGASLRVPGLPGYVYASSQDSRSTAHPDFVVGAMAGDFDNHLTGSAIGILIAGQTYLFEYGTQINASPSGAFTNASATGYARLQLSAIPEPATGLLLGLGLATIGLRQKVR